MSTDETRLYLEAKRNAQGKQVQEQPQTASASSSKKTKTKNDAAPTVVAPAHEMTNQEGQLALQSAQPLVAMQAVRQLLEEVVRAECQAIHAVQPVVDVQAVQHAVQSVVRAELHPLQAAVTMMANALQAQTDALMTGDAAEEEGEEDDPLPTALPSHTTDDDEASEDEQVYPPDEEEDDDIDEEREPGEDEGEGGEEEPYPLHPPRPESPTHRLRRPGPTGLLFGDAITRHPSQGIRRWEPSYEQ